MSPQLTNYDLLTIVRRMPAPLRALVKERAGQLIVAGGYIRSCISGDTVNDVDVFSPNADIARSCAHIIAKDQYRVHESPNAITIWTKPFPIQFVHRWTFPSPASCIDSFDFTIARAAVWFDGSRWQSVADPDFYADLAARRLVYRSPIRIEEVGGSLLRVLKFYQRGYRIPLDSLGAVIARLVHNLDYKRPIDEVDEAHVARVLTGLLREVDPLIDPDHISHLNTLPSSTEDVSDEEKA